MISISIKSKFNFKSQISQISSNYDINFVTNNKLLIITYFG